MRRLLIAHPRSGSSWLRRMLEWDPARAFRQHWVFTHDNVTITTDGRVRRWKSRLHKWRDHSVICLVRDPRDIAYSLYFFCRYRCQNVGVEIEPFMETEVRAVTDYYEALRQNADLFVRYHLIHYEVLVSKPVATLTEAIEFWGLPLGDVEAIVQTNNFSDLQKRDKRRRYNRPDFKWNYDGDERTLHIREGKIGGWRRRFRPEQLPSVPEWMAGDAFQESPR